MCVGMIWCLIVCLSYVYWNIVVLNSDVGVFVLYLSSLVGDLLL